MSTIRITNTLAREKQVFEPIDPANVRLYVCGPTVYDRAHIGNARPVVVFDTLFRLLRHVYGAGQVTYARNITDVDDKIITAARENGEPIDDLTRRTTEAFHADMGALNALKPSVEPCATQHIDDMIALIQRLVATGHAYAAEGHVLFSVPSDPAYGQLSRRDREEMIAGARVEVAPYKQDPADFVLWKPAADGEPGWDSPWGRGRPGWHIECSAMSAKHLGETFDIHGGGQDLIFPHHENEIAQSHCGTDGQFARYWMHNGYLVVHGEKMSKSLGNFFTVKELLDAGWAGEAIRLVLLSAQYRQPLDFNRDKLADATANLDRLYTALRNTADVETADGGPPPALTDALADDLNTPEALAQLYEAGHALNKATGADAKARAKAELQAGGRLLGLLEQDPEAWFKGAGDDAEAAEIERLIAERTQARRNKDFATADKIRDDLKARGIVLEDGPEGTTWKRER
ncbi:cysteine--tRNA ligase [Rhodovibrio sodomensis]|uniref:Cysteine--tRNA ligase n=1 Tax=Rhodovibrio sodomensis TaxID=1088 RepID=A0ABS1DHD1_9PROT|nr:cysteine--tRNA ligase [Rhodovibrio sodomensis]